MMATLAKMGMALLTNDEVRKKVGWVLVALLSPLILLVALLCCLGSGAANHNNAMMDYCFYGTSYTGEIPTEFAGQMAFMRSAFSSLDSAVREINDIAETDGLDPIQVKAAFYILCSGGELDADTFMSCFYTLEERTRTVTTTSEDGEEIEAEENYTVSVPCSIDTAYQQLEGFLGRVITEEEKESIQSICLRATDPSV